MLHFQKISWKLELVPLYTSINQRFPKIKRLSNLCNKLPHWFKEPFFYRVDHIVTSQLHYWWCLVARWLSCARRILVSQCFHGPSDSQKPDETSEQQRFRANRSEKRVSAALFSAGSRGIWSSKLKNQPYILRCQLAYDKIFCASCKAATWKYAVLLYSFADATYPREGTVTWLGNTFTATKSMMQHIPVRGR